MDSGPVLPLLQLMYNSKGAGIQAIMDGNGINDRPHYDLI